MKLFTTTPVSGWTSIIFVIVFLQSIQFLLIGFIGEYVGRTYFEAKKRP